MSSIRRSRFGKSKIDRENRDWKLLVTKAYLSFFLSLCETKTSDENFPGFGYLIEQLSKCKDHQLVWQYVDWAMSKDQRLAVEIFTKRASDELVSERMRTEAIVENLEKYPDALCLYLEYLINVKNLKVRLIFIGF